MLLTLSVFLKICYLLFVVVDNHFGFLSLFCQFVCSSVKHTPYIPTLCSGEWSQVLWWQCHTQSVQCWELSPDLSVFEVSSLPTKGKPSPTPLAFWSFFFFNSRALQSHSPWYNNSAFELRLMISYSLGNRGPWSKGAVFQLNKE